jgi:hypothetical protein
LLEYTDAKFADSREEVLLELMTDDRLVDAHGSDRVALEMGAAGRQLQAKRYVEEGTSTPKLSVNPLP